ncbi:50S ribosomal protein L37ae [Candidatus Woesearchaeota archaeon]|nr:50S ribosomal protein L37ae [Candidatus Woesearchaeota archaeon]
MADTQNLKSIKRFGARYGRTVKWNFGKMEAEQRKLHKCPYCNKVAVKRISAGIWECRKCDSAFTGRAYTLKAEVKVEG